MVSAQAGNVHEYTVSELSGAVKRSIEENFGFVRVRGELGRVTRPGSGHVYLDLKDDKSVLSGVMWKGMAARLKIRPEQGMEVIATGRMTTFAGQSRYQIIIDSIEPAGVGALMALYEERKKKLAAEGLFAPERKREIPFLPQVIGVVTSPTGAVIRDILHRLRERFPRHVMVWPTVVQGRGAEDRIAEAIDGFNALEPDGDIPRPDVLIVARGGGSIEDLWCFNEEVVARAAAASRIPLISAVGHETDTTLIDYVADRRAPTPTAAAEMAVPVRSELVGEILNKERRMVGAGARLIEMRRNALRSAERGLGRPEDMMGSAQQRLDRLGDQLAAGLRGKAARAETSLASRGRLTSTTLSTALARKKNDAAGLGARLPAAAALPLRQARERINALRLPSLALRRHLESEGAGVGKLAGRIAALAPRLMRDRRERLTAQARLLESFSYENVLERGFALVRDSNGALVRRAASAPKTGPGEIRFRDGVTAITFADGQGSKRERGSGGRPAKPEQQRLFD